MVYVVPVTVASETSASESQLSADSFHCTLYPVISAPPFDDGACQEASSSWISSPVATVRLRGCVGTVAATAVVATLVRVSALFRSSVKETLTLIAVPASPLAGTYVEPVAPSMFTSSAIHWYL